MRADANRRGDVDRMQAWAGQSASIGRARPAADLVRELWDGGTSLLR